MASFNSSEAIKAIAASLGKQAVRNYESSKYGNPKNAVKGSIAEYNRVVREAKSVFTRDPHVQALEALSYVGRARQAADAVATAAKALANTTEGLEESPRKLASETAPVLEFPSPSYRLLDQLPYSGRFSPDAIKLAGVLGRWFSPDAKDENGWTDLHYAAALNLPGLASALLDAGVDPNARLKGDGKPFGGELAGTLSALGRDLDGDDLADWARNGQTPLHFAAWFNADLATPHLVVGGSKVDEQSRASRTPLCLAAWQNARTVAEFLIGRGADVRAASRNHWTPTDYALYSKAPETAAVLRRHGGQCKRACQ